MNADKNFKPLFSFQVFKAIIHINKIYYDYHIYPLFLLPHSFLNLPSPLCKVCKSIL